MYWMKFYYFVKYKNNIKIYKVNNKIETKILNQYFPKSPAVKLFTFGHIWMPGSMIHHDPPNQFSLTAHLMHHMHDLDHE